MGRDPGRPSALVARVGFRAGPWTARSLEAAGWRVIAGDDSLGLGGRSVACLRPARYPSPGGDPAGFVDWVARTCRREDVRVVVPTDEEGVRALAEEAPDLGGAVVAGPDGEQYRRLCDKGELGATCAAVGVAHPPSVRVRPDGTPDAGAWPALPGVVKPQRSARQADDLDAVRVDTPAEREHHVRRMLDAGAGAVVQELIDGTAWVVHCVRASDDRFAGVSARVLTTYPRRVGMSSVSRVEPDAPAPLLDGARRLLDAVDYRGPCGINVIERDGVFHFHDVNLRLAASVGAAVAAGLDLPRLGVEAALGRPAAVVQPPVRRITYVRIDGEVRQVADRLRGRTGEASRDAVASLAQGLVRRDWILDPLDPIWASVAVLNWLRGSRAYRGVRSRVHHRAA